eukprot:XP_014012470.1 PREDICTED: protachykinin-like [Salmo salar]
MDIWKFQLVIVTLYSLVYTCQGLSFSVDKEHWVSKDWQDKPLEKRLANQVASLIKRSKAHQFYGLMGKRSDVQPQPGQPQPIRVNRRRNKGEMFVGLMGRRASSGELFTRIIPDATSTAIDIAEGSHTQPDSQEAWDQLLYYYS